jgi:hypothetical protein
MPCNSVEILTDVASAKGYVRASGNRPNAPEKPTSLDINGLGLREGWIPDRFGQPTSQRNPFSARSCRRNFPLFSRVVAVGLLTAGPRQGARAVLCEAAFSEAVDFAISVNSFGPLILHGYLEPPQGAVRDKPWGCNSSRPPISQLVGSGQWLDPSSRRACLAPRL